MNIKDTDKYIANGGLYKDLVKKEIGFSTRIYGGWFKKDRFEITKESDLTTGVRAKGDLEVILNYKKLGYLNKEDVSKEFFEKFVRRSALDLQEKLTLNEVLKLKKQPDNPFDSKAVGVYNSKDQFLGYIKRDLAQYMEDVDNFHVFVQETIDREAIGKKNEIGTQIIVINKKNYEKAKKEKKNSN